MARIELSPEIRKDFDRMLEHLQKFDVTEPSARFEEIAGVLPILGHNPLIGEPIQNELRELVIGRGAHGDIAL